MLAGFAQSDITPPLGVTLDGFFARTAPASGVDCPLAARALVLRQGEATLILVTLDLLGLARAAAEAMTRELARQEGISEAGVVLACSHTHSGPMSCLVRGLGPPDQAYLLGVRETVAKVVRRAVAEARPVRLRLGHAPLSLGVNRRQVQADGRAKLAPNPSGPCDTQVRVLVAEGGPCPIVWCSHACHPYILPPDCSLISADFAGHAMSALAGHGVDALYTNGCAGNIMPLAAFQGPAASRSEGLRLAAATLSAMANARTPDEAGLAVASATVDLPYDTLPPQAELEAEWASHADDRYGRAMRSWLADLRAARRPDGSLPPLPARVTVVRLGQDALVFLPGEIFYEIGLDLAASLPATRTWVTGYCHEFIGYVPTPAAWPQGGYEVDSAHRFLGLWRVAPESGARLVATALELWRSLAQP